VWQNISFLPNYTHPPIRTSIVAPIVQTTMSMQGGMMLRQVELYILGNSGIKNDKKDVWLLEKMLVMLGC
jgi:hypothetical protein